MVVHRIVITLSIFIFFFIFISDLKSQQIVHWEGSNTVSKFKCARTLDLFGHLVEYTYYLGILKTDSHIVNGNVYHSLVLGDDTTSIVGYIRRECNLVFILDKDRTIESPLFILAHLDPTFSFNIPFLLGGTLGGIKSIIQDTCWQVKKNGDIIQYYRFRLNNPTPPADAVKITKVTLSNAGIHSFTIRPSIGPEVECNCESSIIN